MAASEQCCFAHGLNIDDVELIVDAEDVGESVGGYIVSEDLAVGEGGVERGG